MPTKVVNVRTHKGEYTYIGRGSEFGNPFVIGVHGSRGEVIEQYRQWLLKQPDLLKRVKSLKGKTLGCFCKPRACHGDVLAAIAEGGAEPRVTKIPPARIVRSKSVNRPWKGAMIVP